MNDDLFNNKPWFKNVVPEDFKNEDLKMIASFAGAEAAILLLYFMPGFIFTIPQAEEIILKKKYIKKQYDGTKSTRRRLAVECGFSESYIYKIIREKV